MERQSQSFQLTQLFVHSIRVNDLNSEGLLSLFLPLHTTPHWPSALALVPDNVLATSAFASLIPAKKSLSPLPLASLIALFPPFSKLNSARPLLDAVLALPLSYLHADETPHRALVGFWLQAVAGFLDRAGPGLPAGERAAVLATVLEVVQLARAQPDLLIASYILLARFSLHNPFEGETLRVVMKTVVSSRARAAVADDETDAALVTTLVVISQLGEGEIVVPEGKKFLGGTGWRTLVKVDRLGPIIVSLCNQYNATRFMKPFLSTLAVDALANSGSSTLLGELLIPVVSDDEPVLLPEAIVALLASSSVSALLGASADEPTNSDALLRVLHQVYQRWPEVWEAETAARSGAPAPVQKKLSAVINAVLGGGSSSLAAGGSFLASASADVATRVLALEELLGATELHEANPAFVADTLRARLSEPVEQVQRVVLSPAGVVVLHSALGEDEILAKLAVVARSKDAALLKVVLAYLAGPYVKAYPAQATEVIQAVFWPRLLGSKDGAEERTAAWNALGGSGLASHAWLAGVPALFESGTEAATVAANSAVAARLATNLAALPADELAAAQAFLLSQVSADRATNSSTVSLLVTTRLAAELPPAGRVAFSAALLAALRVEAAGLDALAGAQAEKADAALLAQAIFAKPVAAKTVRRVRAAAVVALVSAVQPAPAWSWLAGGERSAFQAFVFAVYRLAHTATTPGAAELSSVLLDAVFGQLVTEDALAFLASVWTATSSPTSLKAVALRDAGVLVAVQALPELHKSVDFQAVVPAVIVALQDASHKVRAEAVELLQAISQAMPPTAAHIYGRGLLYGPARSGEVKFLDVADVAKYVHKLVASKVELVMDRAYVAVLHETGLDPSGEEPKKKGLKFKAATFLLSHVAAWADLDARTALLRTLSGVRDAAKNALVIPVLAEALKLAEAQRAALAAGVAPEVVAEYGALLVQPYQGASRKFLDQADNGAWEVLLATIELTDSAGLGAVLRKEALALVRSSVFALVRGESRLELFRRLVRLAANANAQQLGDVLGALRGCKVDGETLTGFLAEMRTALGSPVSKGAKRGRVSISGPPGSRTERVPELVVVLESVEFQSIPASHQVLLNLFDILSTLIELSTSAQLDIQYPGQLLLSALSKVVANVEPGSGVSSDSIRMAPVLDLMRSSANPQTSHQALLLLAQLGPVVPDQLVHHIMPIFTFMGANVLQRDDAYSLRVVEQTLDAIVPALVSSTKRTSGSRDKLVGDLKDLVRVFTDAATHVPRHRRNKLFVRFVATLGPKEFLSAVCMLLVDRAAKPAEACALPLAVLDCFPVDVQLAALGQVVEEGSRLIVGETQGRETPFLDVAEGGSQGQVLQLIRFVTESLEAKQLSAKVDAARATGEVDVDQTLSALVRALLGLATVAEGYSTKELAALQVAAGEGVEAAVQIMSIAAFSEAILWFLDLADKRMHSAALSLVQVRLPAIKPARRADLSPAVVAVVEKVKAMLADNEDDGDVAAGLATLDVVVSSAFPAEDAALAKTVPELMALAGIASAQPKLIKAAALAVLTKLTHRLGPRLIPLVAKLVPFAVQVLRDEARDVAGATVALVAGAFAVLEGLFVSIPTFIGANLDKVFEAALSEDIIELTKEGPAARARGSLLSTAAKRVPAKTLYPAIIRLHATLAAGAQTRGPLLALLDLLNRGLRQGKAADIVDNFRPVFKLFLTVFDLRRLRPAGWDEDEVAVVEDNALGAFVQFILKLNEQTFRPMFLRTYDWAVIDLVEGDAADKEQALTARRIVLYKVVDRLLGQLKSIFVPYYSFMLDQTLELLAGFAAGTEQSEPLWRVVVATLTQALAHDEAHFWTPLRLGKLLGPLANQLVSPLRLALANQASAFHPLLAELAALLAPHEALLKQLNSRLLMLTREDDLRVKRGALEALEEVWDVVGDGMLGLVPETTPFLSECLEETEGGVERSAKRLIAKIEEHLGESLEEYLN